MNALEDHWNKVISDDRYKGLDHDKQEQVRKNFYRHFVFSSSAYQAMPEERRYAIRQDFDNRTKAPPAPGLMDRLKTQIPEVVRGAGQAAKMLPAAAETLVGEQSPIGKVHKAVSEIPIPGAKPLVEGLHKV